MGYLPNILIKQHGLIKFVSQFNHSLVSQFLVSFITRQQNFLLIPVVVTSELRNWR